MQYNTSSSENYSSSLRDTPSKWNGKDDKGYVYKKSSYQYSDSGKNSSYVDKPMDQNVDQLDALLEDLKTERQITRDRDLLSSSANYRTIERERGDPVGTITKTTRVIKTSKHSGGNQLPDDIQNFSTSDYSTLNSNGYSGLQNTMKFDDYATKANTYDSRKHTSANIYESKNKILNDVELVPSTTTITTSTPLDEDLQNIALSDGILPIPGTKVTTTVRTYTYEIPAGGTTTTTTSNTIGNRSHQLHNSLNYNTIQQHSELKSGGSHQPSPHPIATIPQTVVYNTESYSTIDRQNDRPIISNQTYEVREHRETNTNTIRNGGLPPQQTLRSPPNSPPGSGPSTNTIVYNVHNTTENIHTLPLEPRNSPRSPPVHTQHVPIIGGPGPHSPPHDNYPPSGGPGPTTNRYYYHESSNSVNTVHEPGAPVLPQPNVPHFTHNAAPPTLPPHNLSPTGYPPHGDGYPPQGPPNNSTMTYKYSSSTMNSRRGPDYGTPSPTGPLAPFPVDGVDFHPNNGNPPQRVDDLMQSFGNADTVDRSDIHTPHRKREIETSVASPNQQNIPTVNRAGKEVYYPPGHETTMIKREEMHAGSQAGGRWAKGSGMYEYESGSKSKTTTKSGGAMVPVCLPLCCAMPCSIM